MNRPDFEKQSLQVPRWDIGRISSPDLCRPLPVFAAIGSPSERVASGVNGDRSLPAFGHGSNDSFCNSYAMFLSLVPSKGVTQGSMLHSVDLLFCLVSP